MASVHGEVRIEIRLARRALSGGCAHVGGLNNRGDFLYMCSCTLFTMLAEGYGLQSVYSGLEFRLQLLDERLGSKSHPPGWSVLCGLASNSTHTGVLQNRSHTIKPTISLPSQSDVKTQQRSECFFSFSETPLCRGPGMMDGTILNVDSWDQKIPPPPLSYSDVR